MTVHEELERTRDEVRRVYEALESGQERRGRRSRIEESRRRSRFSTTWSKSCIRPATECPITHYRPQSRDRRRPGRLGGFRESDHDGTGQLSETDMLDIMRDALRQNRVDLFATDRQPTQRKHRYFECFSAVYATPMTPSSRQTDIEIAKKSGLIKAIDNMLLFRCIQLVKKIQKHDYTTSFFCNVSPTTRADREFFQEFARVSSATKICSIVFEFSQADIAAIRRKSSRCRAS